LPCRFHARLKKSSSAWVHEQIGLESFAWQEGYAAFTAGATARHSVAQYIANQEKHHAKRSYRDELIDMLERAGVDYDRRFLD
jgi:REP element-mobilizing transposase RayT